MLCQNTKIGFGNNTVTAVLSEMMLTPLHRIEIMKKDLVIKTHA